jgi:WD40 repeat protein
MRTVMLAAPSYDGKINVWHATALVETCKIGLANNINIIPVYMSYDALVQRARNDIFKLAHDSGVTDLIFIDCDVDWTPSDLFKLLDHDAPIVAAPIIKKTFAAHTYSVKTKNLTPEDNGLIEVDGAATGFMRIRADAIKKIWDSAPEYREPHKPEPNRMVFDVRVVDGELWSEDIVFCKTWQDLGGRVYIDPTINCGHSGEHRWIGNFEAFMQNIDAEHEQA